MEGKKWTPFENDVYLFYFYNPLTVVVDWLNNGKEIKEYIVQRYPYLNGKWAWVVKNERFYFLPGIGWSVGLQRSQLKRVLGLQRIPYRLLPTGCIFGVAAQGLILHKEEDNWWLLSLLCSKVAFCFLGLIVPDKMPGTGPCANLPIAKLTDDEKNKLGNLAKEAYSLLREHDTGNEPSTHFIMP